MQDMIKFQINILHIVKLLFISAKLQFIHEDMMVILVKILFLYPFFKIS